MSLLAPHTPVVRRLGYLSCAAAVMLFSGQVSADNATAPPGGLTVQAVGTETGIWESNPLLLNSGATALYGSTTSPELIINDSTPTKKLTADTLVNVNEFNQSSFDSTDVHSVIDFRDAKQRWSGEIQARTDYDTTRTSELSTFGTNQGTVRHTGFQLAPQIAFSPTSIDTIALSATGQIARYETTAFTDYNILSVTPSYTHSFDPLNSGTISVLAQQYRSVTGNGVTVESVAPSVGWSTILTPRFIAKANVGLQTTRQYGSGTTATPFKLQYVFAGDLAYKDQTDNADISFSRAEYPFSNGQESLLTGITISEGHTLNQRFSINMGGSYQQATYQSTATGSLDTIMSGTAGLTFHATEHLDVTASYQYRLQSLIGVSSDAEDHTATLGLSYHPKAWSL